MTAWQPLLEPVTPGEAPILGNLYELYAHDFSEHVPLDLNDSGRFEVAVDGVWWKGGDHHPFFIRCAGKLCGFALVKRGSRTTGAAEPMDVTEFFVVRAARGKGVGTRAAHALFGAFPGRWEVRVRRSNAGALTFWSRAVDAWVGRAVTAEPWSAEGVDWEVFRFEHGADRAPAR